VIHQSVDVDGGPHVWLQRTILQTCHLRISTSRYGQTGFT